MLGSSAWAAVDVQAPADWVSGASVDRSASDRANRWSEALGGIVASVHASTGIDDFVETMAVIERDTPVPLEILGDDAKTAAWLDEQLRPITGGSEPQEIGWKLTPNIPAGFAFGRYALADVRLIAMAVPDGDRTVFVLMAARTSEDLFYDPIFEEVRTTAMGGAAPVHPFDLSGHRTWSLVGWLIGLVGAYGLSLAVFSERKGDHRRVGRIAAFILSGAAVAAAIVVYLKLQGQEAALAAVDSSASGLSAEAFGLGALAAGVAFVIGQLLERGEARVQMLPTQADLAARIKAAEAEREDA